MNSNWCTGKKFPIVTAGSSTSRPQTSLPISTGRLLAIVRARRKMPGSWAR
jgi:hypothetical protein